jgi:hypothetical protein
MRVVIQHRIADPERFFSLAEEVVANAPSGVRARQFFPSQDQSAAVCLWEGDSVDAVRDHVDSVTGDSSQNTYFEVNPEYAMGLPELASVGA